MSGCSSVWFSGTNFGKGHFEKQFSETVCNLKCSTQDKPNLLKIDTILYLLYQRLRNKDLFRL